MVPIIVHSFSECEQCDLTQQCIVRMAVLAENKWTLSLYSEQCEKKFHAAQEHVRGKEIPQQCIEITNTDLLLQVVIFTLQLASPQRTMGGSNTAPKSLVARHFHCLCYEHAGKLFHLFLRTLVKKMFCLDACV